MTTFRTTYGSSDISDTGMAIPRGIPLRPTISLADDTGLQVPSSAWAIPAAVIQHANGAGSMQTAAPLEKGNGAGPMPQPPEAEVRRGFDRIDRANDSLAGMTAKMIFIDCIWISKEPAINKLLLLCISRFFKPNATTATMSYSRLAEDCGFSVRTGIRAAKEVRDSWLRIGVQKGHRTASGQNNLYVGTPPPELVEELRRRKAKGEVITPDDAIIEAAEGMTQSHALPEEGVTECHASGARGDSLSSRGDRDDTLNTKEQEEDSLSGAIRWGTPSDGRSPPARKAGADSKLQEARLALDLYVETAQRCALSKPRVAGPKLLGKLAVRLKAIGGLDGWREVLARIEASRFLQGDSESGWKPDIHWLAKNDENLDKVLSGKFDNHGRRAPRGGEGVF